MHFAQTKAIILALILGQPYNKRKASLFSGKADAFLYECRFAASVINRVFFIQKIRVTDMGDNVYGSNGISGRNNSFPK